jgi:hypothetical protein
MQATTANLINLKTARKARRQRRAAGVTLCRNGFHKWTTVTERRFEVHAGKLLTAERCPRCQVVRTRLL